MVCVQAMPESERVGEEGGGGEEGVEAQDQGGGGPGQEVAED